MAYIRPVSRSHLTMLVLLAVLVASCGGSPSAPSEDEVFYLHQRGVIDKRYAWERYFPPLDADGTERLPRRVGVAVLDGDVRLSRPVDWYLRTADYSAQKRQISYQSPRQFLFSIYERVDPPRATWAEVLDRYEADLEAQGATILSARVPVSTANAQGRSYLVRTRIPSRPDYEAFAHEILIRSGERILLVQIVHDENFEDSELEMTTVLQSMLVY